ncbi:superoxide dismutase family protein [Cryptosporangium aurantiacum]|uniref:Superoxide dismutase, Cu-Zn family n=1 Tax=Cryptosporangium aurantiacum TaxID=134849 RepID=A0A1M7RGY7_9ACTN|nr:superoxide dismutase family protein [Cryptosporangium aurantiacum]SHN45553.1 superoxide dismutase, Cu-Zn family [Cryptosporangium aurantiacum]
MRRSAALVLVATSLLAAGCGGASREDGGSQEESASAAVEAAQPMVAEGTFGSYSPTSVAVTYDPSLVPPGATARLTIAEIADATTVTLDVGGMKPDRTYGAHLHTKPCGATGTAAGPHYQHRPDPAASASPPSVNPTYANPQNEVWLDFTTDSQGTGISKSTQPWRFTTKPQSLIIHAQKTQTAPGKAGIAGPRLACLTVKG